MPHPDATFVSAPKTAVPETVVVEADNGFEWADAAIGGGAALLLTAVGRRRRADHPSPPRGRPALTHRPTFGRAAEYGPPAGVNPE